MTTHVFGRGFVILVALERVVSVEFAARFWQILYVGDGVGHAQTVLGLGGLLEPRATQIVGAWSVLVVSAMWCGEVDIGARGDLNTARRFTVEHAV